MNLFDSQLQRLKERLGVAQDQDVAAALGMTKAAFSYRKRNDDFPVERLISLKSKLPDLDLQYILFGESWDRTSAAKHDRFLATASALGLNPNEVAKSVVPGVKQHEQMIREAVDYPPVRSLIETLLWCDDDAIDLVSRVAAAARGERRLPFAERLSRQAVEAPAGGTTSGHEAAARAKPKPKRR